jgi:phage shock protein A
MTTVIKAKLSHLLDRAEDPRETLDYAYERQLQLLQQVRRGIVDVTTSKRRLEIQRGQLQQKVDQLTEQAKQALAVGHEDLARMALERKALAQQQITELDQQIATLEQEQAKLEQAEMRLRTKVEAFRTRKEVIKAQYSSAEAQVRINEAVTGISEEMADVGLALERAERKTEELQARAGAIDELLASGALEDVTAGSGQDDISRELSRVTVSQSIDAELAALRRELGQPEQPKPLGEGKQAQ